jgi:AcrR family transcriptional regulator
MAPKTDIQNQEIRKKSKQKIIHASIELFSESGFAGTPISKIAKKAGVSKGLIYNYFETKEDIVKGIIDSLLDEFKETEQEIMEAFQKATPNETIALIVDQTYDFMIKNKQKWRLVTILGFKISEFPYVHDIMVKKYQDYIQLFTGIFTQLEYKNPTIEAKLLAAQFDGIGMQYLMFNDEEYPLKEILDGLKNKYKNE